MAVKQIGITVGGNKKEYLAYTTDSVDTYLTDCGAGCTITLISPSTHTVTGGLYFHGTNWNTV